MVQHDVDHSVLMKLVFERIRVEQNVRRLAENSSDVGQELHASHVQLHLARLADDEVAKQSQHKDGVNALRSKGFDVGILAAVVNSVAEKNSCRA